MKPEFVQLPDLLIVGMHVETSLLESHTQQLWKGFMSRQRNILHRADQAYYALQFYPEGYFGPAFTPGMKFEEWAGVSVSSVDDVPEGMDILRIPGGAFAKFLYKGLAKDFGNMARYMYSEWLPSSGKSVAQKAHFQVMGDKYLGPDNPESVEEVFVPLID